MTDQLCLPQIRLNDGSRLVARLNHVNTVGDLRQYIVLARPHLAAVPFNLLTTFPSKVGGLGKNVVAAGC